MNRPLSYVIALTLGLVACSEAPPTSRRLTAGDAVGCYLLTYDNWGTPPRMGAPMGGRAPQFVDLRSAQIVRPSGRSIDWPDSANGWLRWSVSDTALWPTHWFVDSTGAVALGVALTPDAGLDITLKAPAADGDFVGTASAGSASIQAPPTKSTVRATRIPCWTGA